MKYPTISFSHRSENSLPGRSGDKDVPAAAVVNAWRLARRLPALSPNDSVGTALEAMALQRVDALPVADEDTAIGYVTRADLVASIGGLRQWNENSLSRDRSLLPAVRPFRLAIRQDDGARAIAGAFDESRDPILPVVTEDGRMVGCVFPLDLTAPPDSRITLPPVGGMASPFGVYLTTEGISGGVSPWALMATGAILAIAIFLSETFTTKLLSFLLAWPVTAILAHRLETQSSSAFQAAVDAFQFLIFLALIRIHPLSGYHAAEHQAVHTIEAREPLTPERVQSKPRVHPRCGTNLMVLITLACCLVEFVSKHPSIGQPLLPLGLLLIFLFRLSIGGVVQQFFTTRPATGQQIASGIRAARELAENYGRSGGRRCTPWQRLWASGLLQVASGSILTLCVLDGIQSIFQHLPVGHH